MNLKNEFKPIEDWAKDKRIIQDGNMIQQYVKFQEEAGELAKAILKNDKTNVIDAIGDIVVTLVSLSKQAALHFEDDNISIENCINTAYNVIKNRKGIIKNGDFHKDEFRKCECCGGYSFIHVGSVGYVKHCKTCDCSGLIKQ